jgi:hypothetical protein
MAVEGKFSEPFGPTVDEWLRNALEGKRERLRFLEEQLGLDTAVSPGIRYQLLHRGGSAVIEAKRFNATNALMLVHSFSPANDWFDD